MTGDGRSLKPGVGLVGVVMLGAGTAIGVSIFSVLQPAAAVAGSGLLVALAIAAVPMLLFATTYAYLASAAPVSGASYEWPRRFVHPMAGFAVALLRILGSIATLTVLARVLVNYLGMVLPVPPLPAMLAALSLVFALNYRGVGVAAGVQTALMALLVVVLASFVATGAPLARPALLGSPTAVGTGAIVACVPLMISLFLGIEAAVEIGEEVRAPRRTIPLGIGLAIGLTLLIYGTVATTALGLVGPHALAASKAPLLDAARVPLGRWAVPLVVGAAAASILKTMNATAMIFSRAIFAMARAGALPGRLAAVHPRFGTPHRAVLICYLAALTGLLLPSSLVFLLLAVNIPTMVKYLACSLAAVRVATRHPELHGRALPFSPAAVRWTGGLAIAASVGIILAGLGADWRPYALVGGWLGVGLAGYRLRVFRG